MKLIKLAFTGLLVSGLLTGCTNEGTKVAQDKTEETKVEQVKKEAEVNDPKTWKDVSTPEGFNSYGIEPTLEAWIAYHAEDITKTTDVKEYYPRAYRLRNEMKYFRIQGDDLQKDFDNLEVLQTLMGNLVYSISVAEKQGIETVESYDELKKSFKYFTELVHDIDIVINHDGKGETFGFTHQLDGKKVEEIETFIYID
ncbi:hypothetical protein ACIQXW_09975 [Lysinibacillus sp. NPDC097162]|uniref:hypothetical protein n=1 Tax=Lysinibacillus sp. NPDC097162 TaxID=3364140 RepID=UPI0037F92490